jgi:hypothetical protein
MAHGLRLDSQLTLALKAVIQADAIGRALFPGTNVGEMALAVTIGVLLVGMIIGSAIAADISATRQFVWPILPDLPLLGYVISMIVAGIFVIRLILQRFQGGQEE